MLLRIIGGLRRLAHAAAQQIVDQGHAASICNRQPKFGHGVEVACGAVCPGAVVSASTDTCRLDSEQRPRRAQSRNSARPRPLPCCEWSIARRPTPTAGGASDGEVVYDAVADRHPGAAAVIVSPRVTAVADETMSTQRSRRIATILARARAHWGGPSFRLQSTEPGRKPRLSLAGASAPGRCTIHKKPMRKSGAMCSTDVGVRHADLIGDKQSRGGGRTTQTASAQSEQESGQLSIFRAAGMTTTDRPCSLGSPSKRQRPLPVTTDRCLHRSAERQAFRRQGALALRTFDADRNAAAG